MQKQYLSSSVYQKESFNSEASDPMIISEYRAYISSTQ